MSIGNRDDNGNGTASLLPWRTYAVDRFDAPRTETARMEASPSPRAALNVAAESDPAPSPLPFHQGNYMEFAPRITVVGCGGAGGNAGTLQYGISVALTPPALFAGVDVPSSFSLIMFKIIRSFRGLNPRA